MFYYQCLFFSDYLLTRYFYYGRPATLQQAKLYEDEYGDSYTRTTDVLEIAKILKRLNAVSIGHLDFQAVNELKTDLIEIDMRSILGLILPFKIYFDRPSLAQINNLGAPTKINKIIEQDFDLAERYALFCGASIELSIHDLGVAFIIVHPEDSTRLRLLRAVNAVKPVPIRIISIEWIYECWKAKSRLAEDRPQFIVHEK